VLDAHAHGRVNIKFAQVRWGNPADLRRLAARTEFAADRARAEADGELLPNLALVVQHHVARICVNPGQVDDFDLDAGLFPDLAHDGVADVVAAGESPPAVV
jgi:hypothetical protein